MFGEAKSFQEILSDFCGQLKANGYSLPQSIELTEKDLCDVATECKYYPWIADDMDECNEFEMGTISGAVKLWKKRSKK